MYSGTTFRNKSGYVLGVHQKIDRVSKRHLRLIAPEVWFPSIRHILHFEGKNGPDGIKRKSPSKDEPWHYIDPKDSTDSQLLEMIDDHIVNLTMALTAQDETRAAFEAAWLAHAITDGLTPAHHYPLEEKLESLRGGEGLETRTNIRKKLFMPGKTKRMKIRNNWEYWGAKGVMTTHLLFELGVSTTIASRRLGPAKPSGNDIIRLEREGLRTLFLEHLHAIDDLHMYETFHRTGWTRPLATQTVHELLPYIIRTVTLAWYDAVKKAVTKQ